MPNRKVFCNSPWYELHVYWDGSLAFCCHATPNLPYDVSDKSIYNIKNMSIRQWYNSVPMREARLKMFEDDRWDHCSRCWHEEAMGTTSRRHRSNQKSVIFTKQNFHDSYEQSPGFVNFDYSARNQGAHDGMPIDLHIDLGNYCNLACKMCGPQASSRIASQYKRWNLLQETATDWTQDSAVWQRFCAEIVEITKLKNIHFMGGETIIQEKFQNLIDFLIENGRTDVNISFVTNGTTFDQQLIDKLKKFPRVGIEISMESLDRTNEYTRQGTDNLAVEQNLALYQSQCNGSSITVTLRPAPSLLTVKSYWQVIKFALEKQYLIKSNLCTSPRFLDIEILPRNIRQSYKYFYETLIDQFNLTDSELTRDFNESDPFNYKAVAKNQIMQILNLLDRPEACDQDINLKKLVEHLDRWDRVYGFDARQIYPEMAEIFGKHGYLQNPS